MSEFIGLIMKKLEEENLRGDRSTTENYQKRLRIQGYRFVPTVNDWAGTFPDGTVGVVLNGSDNTDWTITFVGTDDYAIRRNFDNKEFAYNFFNNLPSVIMICDLLDAGFN